MHARPSPDRDDLRIGYLGHATTLIELDGIRVLTDPVLRDRVWHLRRHPPPPRGELYRDIDAVVISHGHADHNDPRSLRMLDLDGPIIVPSGRGGHLRRRGFAQVVEIEEGGSVEVGPLTITATPAVHDGRRFPLGPSVPAVGFLIQGSVSAYFAGDTDLFAEMEGLVTGLDLAVLPIWGWGPRVRHGHLDPVRAVEALRRLRPRIAVPIHWGTLSPLFGSRPASDRPTREFRRLASTRVPEVDVRVLRPGETTTVVRR